MDNKEQENFNTGAPRSFSSPWWKSAMQIFSEISTWIAIPIILAVISGKALDTHYKTKPILLLVCSGVAFLVSAYGIVKSVKNFSNKIKS